MSYLSYKRNAIIRNTVIAIALITFSLTALLLKKNECNSYVILGFVYVDIILLVLLSLILYKRLIAIYKIKNANANNKSIKHKIIVSHCLIATIPSAIVFCLGSVFFNVVTHVLYSKPVRDMMQSATSITNLYIDEISDKFEKYIRDVTSNLRNNINMYFVDYLSIDSEIKKISKNNIYVSVIQIFGTSVKNIIATPYSDEIDSRIIIEAKKHLDKDDIYIISDNNKLTSITVLSDKLNLYLVANLNIDRKIIQFRNEIYTTAKKYSEVSIKKASINISFLLLFLITSITVIIGALLIAVIQAQKIVHPMYKLIQYAKSISLDNCKEKKININHTNLEIDTLYHSLNNMTMRLRQQNDELLKSEKMKAWYDIARRITHEIKNPLTPIQLSISRIKTKYQREIISNPEVFTSCIDTIIRQVNHINNIITEFSNFARMPNSKKELSDIISIINEVISIQETTNRNIMFYRNYEYDKFLCNIDSQQINQIMLNLTQNAINSLVENGCNTNYKKEQIMIGFIANDDEITITIEDNGIGFSEQTIERAFEPYYTTRENGTGLGLAIVEKMVTDHGGKTEIGKSEKLGGAKVQITIPNEAERTE